jgi:hypothetical protein
VTNLNQGVPYVTTEAVKLRVLPRARVLRQQLQRLVAGCVLRQMRALRQQFTEVSCFGTRTKFCCRGLQRYAYSVEIRDLYINVSQLVRHSALPPLTYALSSIPEAYLYQSTRDFVVIPWCCGQEMINRPDRVGKIPTEQSRSTVRC